MSLDQEKNQVIWFRYNEYIAQKYHTFMMRVTTIYEVEWIKEATTYESQWAYDNETTISS